MIVEDVSLQVISAARPEWIYPFTGPQPGQFRKTSPGRVTTALRRRQALQIRVMHGDADQIVPYATAAPRAVELVQNGTLKKYPGFPHGMPTTHADLLTFIQS